MQTCGTTFNSQAEDGGVIHYRVCTQIMVFKQRHWLTAEKMITRRFLKVVGKRRRSPTSCGRQPQSPRSWPKRVLGQSAKLTVADSASAPRQSRNQKLSQRDLEINVAKAHGTSSPAAARRHNTRGSHAARVCRREVCAGRALVSFA
ncbi:hypothetical protein EVAR_7225_1 [Eumeta japonica]|uniref:Uncharacterized protein n=1 Tax=Eumeta variegata TaxID=151549 RepID=A0A4C1T575_EUMVA|nr:hypothetical protein EVAR_7225_1 [Eumeta japonica]